MIADLVLWPIFSCFGAFAAVLIQSDDPEVCRLQRICRRTLLAALSAVTLAVVLFKFASGTYGLQSLAVALVLFVVSGVIGSKVEKLCKAKERPIA